MVLACIIPAPSPWTAHAAAAACHAYRPLSAKRDAPVDVYQWFGPALKILFISIFLIFLAGCVPIPTYKTLQPSAYMKVIDHAGKPIDGAKVELISSAYPYGFEKSRVAGRTNHDGEIKFTKMKEWRVEVPLMIHGMEVFFWNWCVSKAGYASIQTHHRDADDFNADALFTLMPGQSETCSIRGEHR